MAVFRIEKTRDYTVMANHHLRNTALSLKAKGLLSLMLSLPEDWDYTTKGLARICRDGVDSIPMSACFLASVGWIWRQRQRALKRSVNASGRITLIPSCKSIGRMCRSFGTSPRSRRRRFLRKQDLKLSRSSPADSRASPSPPRESGGALPMNATCGRRYAALLPNCGPVGCLGKMLLASSIWDSTKRFLTWQKRDTLFSHSYDGTIVLADTGGKYVNYQITN